MNEKQQHPCLRESTQKIKQGKLYQNHSSLCPRSDKDRIKKERKSMFPHGIPEWSVQKSQPLSPTGPQPFPTNAWYPFSELAPPLGQKENT